MIRLLHAGGIGHARLAVFAGTCCNDQSGPAGQPSGSDHQYL
jgi:hypothetical protein